MSKLRLVEKDTYYIGYTDRRIALFENVYPLTNGMSYNSYLIIDKKTCLFDGVDKAVIDNYLEQLEIGLEGRDLDYFVVQHMEPDHACCLIKVIEKHPNVTVVFNEKCFEIFKNFNRGFVPKNHLIVKELDELKLGKHTLLFVFAPMVHWPEVMVTYDKYTKTLFSADAFGVFAPLSGNLFADELDFDHDYLDEARRYYTNIVGKYGMQVQDALKKAATVDIKTLCPLHGPIWRKDLNYILNKYDLWSTYTPEKQGVLIVYGSIYGYTEAAAHIFAEKLADKGIKDIKMYDSSKTDGSYLLSETFKYSHLILLSATYNAGIFTPMEDYLLRIKYHAMENRKYVLVENGSWTPVAGELMHEILSELKGFEQIGKTLTINSALKDEQIPEIDKLVNLIAKDFTKDTLKVDMMYNVSYGLYIVAAKNKDKQTACVVNTISQITNNPDLFIIGLNKQNYTSELITKTKKFNVSVLDVHTPFSLIENFGYKSGRTFDKFNSSVKFAVSKNNGIPYLTQYSNSYIEFEVENVLDFKSHYGFVSKITGVKQLSEEKALTYDSYLKFVKPTPKVDKNVKGWKCKICGYVFEGEELPADFVCPICKHGPKDFEKIGF